MPDSELTASQLRARYGIQPNKKGFSTADENASGSMAPVIAIGLVVLIILGGLAYLLQFR